MITLLCILLASQGVDGHSEVSWDNGISDGVEPVVSVCFVLRRVSNHLSQCLFVTPEPFYTENIKNVK